MTQWRGMTLTKRGERVLKVWETIKLLFAMLGFVLIMGIVGGIETGSIPFP